MWLRIWLKCISWSKWHTKCIYLQIHHYSHLQFQHFQYKTGVPKFKLIKLSADEILFSCNFFLQTAHLKDCLWYFQPKVSKTSSSAAYIYIYYVSSAQRVTVVWNKTNLDEHCANGSLLSLSLLSVSPFWKNFSLFFFFWPMCLCVRIGMCFGMSTFVCVGRCVYLSGCGCMAVFKCDYVCVPVMYINMPCFLTEWRD